jgi:hypothetical protein
MSEVTREDVRRCATRDMPRDSLDDVLEELDFFDDTPRWPFAENMWRLAVLRLAAGDPSKVRSWVKVVTGDWRDVAVAVNEKYGHNWIEEYLK